MSWKLDKERPICPQICERLSVMIASGQLKPQEKLMSVRELALTAGVNPNTVQKAFEQLCSMELIYSARGSGWYVSDNANEAVKVVKRLISEKTENYLCEMQNLGLSYDEVKQYIIDWRGK